MVVVVYNLIDKIDPCILVVCIDAISGKSLYDIYPLIIFLGTIFQSVIQKHHILVLNHIQSYILHLSLVASLSRKVLVFITCSCH